MANTPDVRVKLSAEGVDEVVRAFQQVQKAAQSAGKGSKDIGLLNQALGDLKGLLPQLGIAAAVTGLVALTKSAIDGADELNKLSRKTGASVESLSVLTRAAELADVGTEGLSKGLKKLSVSLVELQTGGGASAEGFRLLGVRAADFKGLKIDEAFVKLSDAFKKAPAGITQTTAAVKIFGKTGADLIPLLQDLGGGGFEDFKKRLEELGLIIDTKTAAKAELLNDELKLLGDTAKGAALALGGGMSDSLIRVTQNLQASAAASQTTFGAIGKGVGFVVEAFVKGVQAIGAFAGALSQLGAFFRQEVTFQDIKKGFFDTIDEEVKKAQSQFPALAKSIGESLDKIKDDAQRADLRKQFAEILSDKDIQVVVGNLQAFQKQVAGAVKAQNDAQAEAALLAQERAIKLSKAISQKAQQAATDVLNIRQAELANENEANQALYDQQLITLEDFYRRKIAITREGIDAEIVALKARKAAIASEKLDPNDENALIEKATRLKAIDNQIRVKNIQGSTQINTEQEAQRKADLALQERRLAFEKQIQEAQGNTYQAALIGIQEEIDKLKKEGGLDPSKIGQFEGLQRGKASFDDIAKGGGLIIDAFNRDQQRIQNQQASGQLFPSQAVDKLRESAQQALPVLQQIAEALKAGAITPEQIAQADAFALSVEQIGISADKAGQDMAKFKEQTEQALTSDLTNFFTHGISEAENFGDAMRGLALSVVDSLKQIAAQMLANIAVQQLMKAASSFGFSDGGLVSAKKFADGGVVTGPGTGTSDSIPARLSHGEFVVRAAAVAQPGVLPLLSAINRGSARASMPAMGGIHHFADGGIVTASEAMTAAHGAGGGPSMVEIGIEEGMFVKRVVHAMGTKEAGRVQIKQIATNQKSVNRAIGR